ncbi:hypothetical protein TWF718_009322 [Orbilia javanica]|uniref:Uncharacterized protein n=1 Tax=Orbilia javanica TaxID=47235 RepID=A0AAN8MVM0_9PEZI
MDLVNKIVPVVQAAKIPQFNDLGSLIWGYLPILTSLILLFLFPELKHAIISFIISLFFKSAEASDTNLTSGISEASIVLTEAITSANSTIITAATEITDTSASLWGSLLR